jgi:hypothetical protein
VGTIEPEESVARGGSSAARCIRSQPPPVMIEPPSRGFRSWLGRVLMLLFAVLFVLGALYSALIVLLGLLTGSWQALIGLIGVALFSGLAVALLGRLGRR